jgi:hypothetical protein
VLDRLFGLVERGAEEHLSDGVRDVLGREPRDFAAHLRPAHG